MLKSLQNNTILNGYYVLTEQHFTTIVIRVFRESNMHAIQQALRRRTPIYRHRFSREQFETISFLLFSQVHITPLSDTLPDGLQQLSTPHPLHFLQGQDSTPNTGKLSFAIYSRAVSTPKVCNTLPWNSSTALYTDIFMQSL